MKLQHILIAGAAAALILPSCSSDTGKPIKELKGLSTGDSISYYLGESLAGQYQSYTRADSTLGGISQKGEFLKGFMKAAELANEGSEAYKRGFMMGIQTAGMFKQMKENWGIDLNLAYIRQGFNYASKGDSIIDQQEAQQALNIIGARLEAQRNMKNQAESKKAVEDAAKKAGGYTSLGDNVMMKITKKAAGQNFRKGDNIEFSMIVKDVKGKEISMLSNPNARGEIGKNFPMESPMTKALIALKPGETADLLVPASVILGGRAEQFGYKAADILHVTISPKAASAAPAEAAPAK